MYQKPFTPTGQGAHGAKLINVNRRTVSPGFISAPIKPCGVTHYTPDHDAAMIARSTYSRDLSSTPRLVQHKNEAKAFYAFLSQVYDHIVNPGHWTEDMREDALSVAQLDSPDLKVVDVGGGTGLLSLYCLFVCLCS